MIVSTPQNQCQAIFYTKMNKLLKHYHPLISKWFQEHVGNPTEIQTLSWHDIAEGEHVLVSAPTGSEFIPVLKERFQVTEDYKQVTLRKNYA